MDISKIRGMKVEAVYACVPSNQIDNEALLGGLYGDEAERIIKATGIKKRCIVDKGTSSLDLCLDCAERMIGELEISKEEIGGVVFVTFTPDRIMPFNASSVQDKLGLDKGIPCFDMNLACSGYGYGMWVASMMARSMKEKILLLDGDVQTAHMTMEDRSTLPVLADGGSATLLSYDDSRKNTWYFTFYTDGSRRNVLTIPAGGSKTPVAEEHLRLRDHEDGSKRRDIDIYMDGFEVFRFVAQDASRLLKEFLEEVKSDGMEPESFIPHQANMYMIKQLAKKIGFSWDDTWRSGDEVGNSASATVPVTIAKDAENHLKDGENLVLLSGFGGGLSISAAVIDLDSDGVYKLYSYAGEINSTDGAG